MLQAARAWRVGFPIAPDVIVTDGTGNVFAEHRVNVDGAYAGSSVVKIDHSGQVAWRHRVHGTSTHPSDEIGAIVPMPDGNVVAAGSVEDIDGSKFIVASLGGADAQELWRSSLGGSVSGAFQYSNRANAAAAAPDGDVVAAGTMLNRVESGEYGDFTVVKLAGTDGRERWRFTLAAPVGEETADAMAIVRGGDVIAAGEVQRTQPYADMVSVVRLDGKTGALVWRRDVDAAWRTSALAVDPMGAIVLAASTSDANGNYFGVVKLAGDSGDVQWIARESGSPDRYQEAVRVVVDASGAVFAAGMTDDGTGDPSGSAGNVFTVVRLDAVTGERVWAYHTTGTAGGAFATHLQLDPRGLVIAAGSMNDRGSCRDGFFVAIDALNGRPVWSRRFDGTYTARRCYPRNCSYHSVHCAPVDNDDVSGLALGSKGHVFVGLSLLDLNGGVAHFHGSVRRLFVPDVSH
jgi:hypothetical protein